MKLSIWFLQIRLTTLQLKNKLTRPDRSKVNAVNDKWDQFEKVLRNTMISHMRG